jgi:signal transduction histidine kinase
LLTRAARKAADATLLHDMELVKKIVQETLQKVRDQSQMFRPAILDDFGLTRTLEWFLGQFSRQTGIRVHLEGEVSEAALPPEAPIHLYRIVQESLSNVARHSGAREAWVVLSHEDDTLYLEIRDDGAGFEPGSQARRSGGVGLMGMRERAEHLNGALEVRSSPGHGTTICVRVPRPQRSSVEESEHELHKKGVGSSG